MKNVKSIYLVVAISLFVGLLHFLIGPGYDGIGKVFIRSYLIDILLPMNLYLLLQISLRKKYSVRLSRIIGALFTFCFGLTVEILQYYGYGLFGKTADPMDILMYAAGVLLGLLIDLLIISGLEQSSGNDQL